MTATLLDVVCPVRLGNRNEELRYAMRSWGINLTHRKIYLYGAPPAWTLDVVKKPMQQSGSDHRMNTTQMMEAACKDPAVSNPFIWLNDDIFVMQPVVKVAHMHRGPIDGVILNHPDKKHDYVQGMAATKNLLMGHGFDEEGILSYELHMPLIVHKETMLYALKVYRDSQRPNLHKRTLYGNIADYGGDRVRDNKIVDANAQWDHGCIYISTSDQSFEKYPVGSWIRDKFPEPSTYEVT